jgi:biopolymer transport protein ExbB/TolQ
MTDDLVGTLMKLPIFEAAWVLWLLIIMSIVSVGAMIERLIFYVSHRVDVGEVRKKLAVLLDSGDFAEAARLLARHDSMETNVVLFGMREHHKGPEAVEDLINGALSREKLRYERLLTFLGTVGSSAPFIGLFGTVLGIIKAFADLAGNMSEASTVVMAGISEALIATAIGLLVAIPAVIAHNAFRTRVKTHVSNTDLLARTLLADLKAQDGGVRTLDAE